MPATSAMINGRSEIDIRAFARDDAQAVLRDYWGDSLPVDPTVIARSMGMSVFTAQLGQDTYGMIIGSEGGAEIYVDEDSPLLRKRFTVAHEIGHSICHREELSEPGIGFYDARSNETSPNATEAYANEFANELLMPAAQFKDAVSSGQSDLDLVALFGVPINSVALRRRALGI